MPLSITTGQLAEQLDARLVGPSDLILTRLDAIDAAQEGALTFIRDQTFADKWASSHAAAALVSERVTVENHDPKTRALIIVPDADLALIALLDLLASTKPKPDPGIDKQAIIHPAATVAPTASIAPGVVIEQDAHVGEQTIIHPNAVIQRGARIGNHCEIHPCVVVGYDCVVGDHCIIHASTAIGPDGFGYRPAPDGQGLIKVPHIGNVVIGQHVEIGANTCIDRAKFGSTTIGDGTKIDNLVQIAHNCKIGRACILCGKAALAGSVTLGDGVILGGSVNIIDNATIGSGTRITAGAGVINDIGPGETWTGAPAMPHREQARIVGALRRIGKGLPPKTRRNAER